MNVDFPKDGLIQLVYASAATVRFSEDELQQLLSVARNNNHSLNISGVLLYKDNTFFQVLEGRRDDVNLLYQKIKQDPRHENVLQLATNCIKVRNFGDWQMGFVCDEEWISELPGFVDFFGNRAFIDLHGDDHRIRNVLAGFKRGRWRRPCSATLSVS